LQSNPKSFIGFELVQNPSIANIKDRKKGVVDKIRFKSKKDSSTERDSSQFEFIIADTTGDMNILKRKYRVK
jgi:hypothetical protein